MKNIILNNIRLCISIISILTNILSNLKAVVISLFLLISTLAHAIDDTQNYIPSNQPEIFTPLFMGSSLTAQANNNPTFSKTTTTVSSIDGEGNPTEALRWENRLTLTGGTITEDVKLNVILVLDTSHSMFEKSDGSYGENSGKIMSMKSAAKTFIEDLISAGHEVALVTFNEYSEKLSGFSTNTDDLKTKVHSITDDIKGTNISAGLDKALEIINSETTSTDQVITVLLGDGAPTFGTYYNSYAGDDVYVNVHSYSRFNFNIGVDNMYYARYGNNSSYYYYYMKNYNQGKEYTQSNLKSGDTYGDGYAYYYESSNPPDGVKSGNPVYSYGYFTREINSSNRNFQNGGYHTYHTNELKPFTNNGTIFDWPILEQITIWSAERLKTKSQLHVIGYEIGTDNNEAPVDFFSSLTSDGGTYSSASTQNAREVLEELSKNIMSMGSEAKVQDQIPEYLNLEIPTDAPNYSYNSSTKIHSWSMSNTDSDGVDRDFTFTYNDETDKLRWDLGDLDFTDPIDFVYYTTLSNDFDYADSSLETTYDADGNLILNVPLNGETNLTYLDYTGTNKQIDVEIPKGDIPVSLSIEKRVVSAATYEMITAGDGIVTDDEFNEINLHPSTEHLLTKEAYYIFRVKNNSYQVVKNIIINDVVENSSLADKIFPTTAPFTLKRKGASSGKDSRIFVWDQKFNRDDAIEVNVATLEIKPKNDNSPHIIKFESNPVYVTKIYTLTYDDGVLATDPNQVPLSTMPNPASSDEIVGDVPVVSNTPTRLGYTFSGWSTDDNENGVVDNGEILYNYGDNFPMPAEDKTLYAIWIPDPLLVETVDVNEIGETTAKLYGKVISGVNIQTYGFIYSAEKYLPADLVYNGDISIIESEVLDPAVEATSIEPFNTGNSNLAPLSDLTNRKGCYFRAFIKKDDGTFAYGEVIRFITEKRDFSLALDGNSRLIADENATDVISSWDADNHFAVDFWIKTDHTSYNSVIIDMESNSKGYSISLDSSGKINISNTAGGLGVSADLVDDGEWHHIAISCDNSTTIFIDGAVSSTSDITYLEPTEQHNMIIGEGFSGNIDALRFWNKPLVEDQVKMLIYDNIQASTDSKVELIGSGDKVSDLEWSNLIASFGFNVCSTLEKTPITPTAIIYQDDDSDDPSVNNLKGNRFFHEDFKQRINLAVIGSAKPSVDLPRVNWKHNATNNSWTESYSWSGYAYPGEGINDDEIDLETYLDVTAAKIEDNYSYAKYSVINRADVATSIPQVKNKAFPNATSSELAVDVLVDMDNSTGTYYVQSEGELTICGGAVREMFKDKIKNHNQGKIKVHNGSVEPHQI